ncbi:DUF6904 family protein [Alkalibacillus aidingensis]|uniref:DUF6904 family protein n=1 Tax=Alkalibacillus aidingensis TaxID=2747607 RepID=UPI0016612EF8|nr:hypothetical protein [Alkalibacillus aidingensis]
MLQITPTPNYSGLEIAGDYYDLEQLYEALHQVVGNEDEHLELYQARMRVLGLCYDIRHAFMGNREYTFVDNGLNEDAMEWLGLDDAKGNLYLTFPIYYPEILMIVMALNDFMDRYESQNAVLKQWDLTVQTVRKFQAAVIQSLQETLKPQTFKMMLNHMSKHSVRFDHYYTQYIDELNIRFLNWDKDQRLKNISIMAKRIAEQGKEYQKAKQQILEAAQESNCHPSEIRYNEEYPDFDEIDW